MQKAVCLVSGGLDSCVAAAEAKKRGCVLAFLHIKYGQRTQKKEQEAFHALANFYEVPDRLTVDIGHLVKIGGSALTDSSIELPVGDPDRPGIPVSYVPFRNANFLAIATSWAEVLQARFIYVGAVEEDSSGYPDCRKSFFQAFNRAILEGTKPETRIEIETPLIHLHKSQIVQRGLDLKAPLGLTWSCYQNEEIACGVCDSCLLRRRGFRQAGAEDPLPYQASKDQL